jgi:hypothetical protein
MNITKPRSQISIRTETPQMNIDKQNASFRVNRRKINNESGLKGSLEFAKGFRDKGKQAAMRGIANAKNDGNFIANPNIPGDKSIPLMVKNKMKRFFQNVDYNIGLMPASSPEITWDKGHMRINWSRHSVVVDWEGDYMPSVDLDSMYSIEVFLRTRPHFRVMVEDAVNSGAPGRYIDHAI